MVIRIKTEETEYSNKEIPSHQQNSAIFNKIIQNKEQHAEIHTSLACFLIS